MVDMGDNSDVSDEGNVFHKNSALAGFLTAHCTILRAICVVNLFAPLAISDIVINMNDDTPNTTTNYTQPTPEANSSKNPKKKLIPLIIIVVLVIAAAASYFVVANAKDLWPFTASKPVASTQPSLKIEKVQLSGEKESEVLDIKLKLTTEDTGHCVLTVSSKLSSLIIDESKKEKGSENTVPTKDCAGWSIGSSGLPNGEYKIDVRFVGATSKLSASDKLTLDR